MEMIMALMSEPEVIDVAKLREIVGRLQGPEVAASLENFRNSFADYWQWRQDRFVFIRGAFAFNMVQPQQLVLSDPTLPKEVRDALEQHTGCSYIDEHCTWESPLDLLCKTACELRTGNELLLLRYGNDHGPHQALLTEIDTWSALSEGHWPEDRATLVGHRR